MSDREARRFDHLSDGHLADKAAYGDSGAFVALADRFHDRVWTAAALASADEGTATRATARSFTRSLAGVAAGIGDPDACIEQALVAAAVELAVTARIDGADLVEQLPPALRALDPATRVALWLTTEGWTEADALAAVTTGTGDPAPALDAVTPAARQAAATLELATPAELAAATADAWHEWQGIGLTIPDRHPLTAVLARLDAPLGRVGDALGRAGARATRTTRRRRARSTAPATPPAPDLLPVVAEAELQGDARPEPFGPRIAAAAASTPLAATALPPGPAPTPDTDTDTNADADADAGDPLLAEVPVPVASRTSFGPQDHDLDQLDRRGRRPRHLVTAGATPTRTRVLAALAAGILTASAMGSLLSTTPADAPGSQGEQVAAAETPAARGEGDLLDDRDLIPTANVSDANADADADIASSATTGGSATPTVGASPRPSGSARDGARPPSSTAAGGGADTGAPAPGSPAPGGPATGGGGASAGPSGSPGGGSGTGGDGSAPAPTAPAPPSTTPPTPPPPPPPPATTNPPPTTTTPPTTTAPPPTTQPPGPICTLLPVLCPGGGLIP